MNSRKKVRKLRGSKTHGGGAMKKRRGAGSRAGRGRAGSGKRADVKKPSYWSWWQPGKHGFVSQTRKTVRSINVADLDKALPSLIDEGKAQKKGDVYTIDLSVLKVDKLLGSGKVRAKVNVTVYTASASAVEKVEAAGGKVTVLAQPKDDAEEK